VKRSSFAEKESVRNFMAYMFENNQTIAEAAQFVPLSGDQLSEEQAKLGEASG
jgi:hypothetical protein